MRECAPRALAVSFALLALVRPQGAGGGEKPAGPPRNVLVEIYASPGPDIGPAASELVGQVAGPGPGLDRVLPIRFLGDASTPAPAGRRLRVDRATNGRGALDPAPRMMIDGRPPRLDTDRPTALAAVRRALEEPPGVTLGLHLDNSGLRKTCSVTVAARSPEVIGRDLVVGLALTEDSMASGVRAGRPFVEPRVVRWSEARGLKLGRSGPRTLAFAVAIEPGSDPSRFRLTAFVRDRASGKVHQAEALPWTRSHDHEPAIARRDPKRTARRPASAFAFASLDHWIASMGSQAAATGDPPEGDWATCSDCGSPYIPRPFGPIIVRPGQVFTGPTTGSC